MEWTQCAALAHTLAAVSARPASLAGARAARPANSIARAVIWAESPGCIQCAANEAQHSDSQHACMQVSAALQASGHLRRHESEQKNSEATDICRNVERFCEMREKPARLHVQGTWQAHGAHANSLAAFCECCEAYLRNPSAPCGLRHNITMESAALHTRQLFSAHRKLLNLASAAVYKRCAECVPL